MKEGTKGIIDFKDGSTARVYVGKEHTYTYLQSDFEIIYDEGETNTQLLHPAVVNGFFLPANLVEKVIRPLPVEQHKD